MRLVTHVHRNRTAFERTRTAHGRARRRPRVFAALTNCHDALPTKKSLYVCVDQIRDERVVMSRRSSTHTAATPSRIFGRQRRVRSFTGGRINWSCSKEARMFHPSRAAVAVSLFALTSLAGSARGTTPVPTRALAVSSPSTSRARFAAVIKGRVTEKETGQ